MLFNCKTSLPSSIKGLHQRCDMTTKKPVGFDQRWTTTIWKRQCSWGNESKITALQSSCKTMLHGRFHNKRCKKGKSWSTEICPTYHIQQPSRKLTIYSPQKRLVENIVNKQPTCLEKAPTDSKSTKEWKTGSKQRLLWNLWENHFSPAISGFDEKTKMYRLKLNCKSQQFHGWEKQENEPSKRSVGIHTICVEVNSPLHFYFVLNSSTLVYRGIIIPFL